MQLKRKVEMLTLQFKCNNHERPCDVKSNNELVIGEEARDFLKQKGSHSSQEFLH